MAAPVPNPTFADLFNTPAVWSRHDPDFTVIDAAIGQTAAANGPNVAAGIHNLATRTPTVVCFMLDSDLDHIYVGHSPQVYPSDPTEVTPMDGRLVVFVGKRPNAHLRIVLPAAAFTCSPADIHCLDIPTIMGANGHGHAPPVLSSGPHAAGDPNTNPLRGRPLNLLPPSFAATAIDTHANGRYTMASFYATFLLGKYDSGNAAEEAMWLPTANWFWLASTHTGAAPTPCMAIQRVPIPVPAHEHLLTQHCESRAAGLMALIGVGGPGLTSAHAFNVGINQLGQVMTNNTTTQIEFERAARTKTFADKHGAALETRLVRFCGQPDASTLPEVHNLLVNAPRGREYSILSSQFAERAKATDLPITVANAPIATPSLLEQVFRSYQPMGNGLALGKGLTPFAIVCEGHDKVEDIKELVKKAELVEGSATVSLSDTSSLTTTDIRLPTLVHITVEKLLGWSVVVDVFHGHGEPIAVSIREAVRDIAPYLNRLVHQSAVTETVGMEQVCRVMFDFQQDYFAFLHRLAADPNATVPTFQETINKVATYRTSGLSELPHGWYSRLQGWKEVGQSRRPGGGTDQGTSPLREQSGTVVWVNPNPDEGLMRRYRESGHTSIKALIGDNAVEVPKIGGKEVCLSWALKGACSGNCKRKDQHRAYGCPVLQKIHDLMDACGVGNSQP